MLPPLALIHHQSLGPVKFPEKPVLIAGSHMLLLLRRGLLLNIYYFVNEIKILTPLLGCLMKF